MTSPTRSLVVVEADGGSRGNPGPAGYGAVVRSASGEVLAERLGTLGVTTNNVAEYAGLIEGLKAAAELGADEVDVRMDSKLVVEQMAGRWQVKHPGLRPLAAEAAALVRRFRAVRFTWIPRAQNKHADKLANAAMDGKSGLEDDLPAESSVGGSSVERSAGVASAGVGSAAAVSSWEPPTGSRLRLVLVRHGETALTSEKRYSGRGDVPLSDRGRAQAATIGARVAAFAPALAAVVTSPLSRCVDTAAALGEVPVVVDDDLVECDFGEWEGLTFAEVRARYPAQLDAWLASTAVAPPNGESFQAVAVRVRRAVRRLRQAYPGQQVAVVSHVSPIKLLLRDALGAGDSLLHRLYLDPAGVSIVDLWPDGGVAVRAVNETAHLLSERAP